MGDSDIAEAIKGLQDNIKALTDSVNSMNKSITEIKTEVTGLRTDFTRIDQKVSDFQTSLEHTQKDVDDTRKEVGEIRKRTEKREEAEEKSHSLLRQIQFENTLMKEQLIKLETYSRRDNLVFSGVIEAEDENDALTLVKIKDVIETEMEVADFEKMKIVRCHRLGTKYPNQKRSRDIIIRFHYFGDKITVWNKRAKLAGSDIYVNDDYPAEVSRRRAALRPVLKLAKSHKEEVKLIGDRIPFNHKFYTADEIHKLPDHLRPAHTKTVEEYILFYGRGSTYSSFYPCHFKVNGVSYNCVEQYYQL